jgi:predicted metalloendopeptidase
MEVETALARVQWDSLDRRNVLKRYNKVTLDKLNDSMPAFDLLGFLRELGKR